MSPVSAAEPPREGDARACAALADFRHELKTLITASEWIAASAANPWTSASGFRGPINVQVPFCRIAGEIQPVEDSSIRFELWLPAREDWSGRFFGTASGGSLGAIQYYSLGMPLRRGFAAMGHDNGHESANTYEQNWAFDADTREVKYEKLVDFASRAQHVATVVAKSVAATFYGQPASHSYFVGCSQGGHHGLMQAQRYPGDYDGIVAGAHGGSWTGMVASQAWAAYQVYRDNRAGALSPQQAALVSRRVQEHCDAKDGLEFGQIEEPRVCNFDLRVMQCAPGQEDTSTCLTPVQVAATQAIYSGLKAPDGRRLAHGFVPGSESYWPWTSEMDLVSGSYYDFFRLLFHRNPDWHLMDMEWEADLQAAAERLGPILDAVDPDLSSFEMRGGKLILYHGWSDGLISPYLSVDMWEAINREMGADRAAKFARLFMVPAMAHCGYGPVGGRRHMQDAWWLTAIQNWVEDGIAPDSGTPRNTVIGTGITIDARLRTRPYCPYPRVARYLGAGDRNLADNFTCEMPLVSPGKASSP